MIENVLATWIDGHTLADILNEGDHPRADVVDRKVHAQVQSVGQDEISEQRDGHTGEHEETEILKGSLVLDEKVQQGAEHEREPQQIWKDEIFVERDLIIDRCVDDENRNSEVFQQNEADQIGNIIK